VIAPVGQALTAGVFTNDRLLDTQNGNGHFLLTQSGCTQANEMKNEHAWSLRPAVLSSEMSRYSSVDYIGKLLIRLGKTSFRRFVMVRERPIAFIFPSFSFKAFIAARQIEQP
jgi:hypothetical protein